MKVQCKACPWRKDVVPERDIPNGYCETKHRALKGTISEGFHLGPLRVMACHESPVGAEAFCVGWLENQLGPGNNLSLRLAVIKGMVPEFRTVGEQHETFEDTLPKKRRKRR